MSSTVSTRPSQPIGPDRLNVLTIVAQVASICERESEMSDSPASTGVTSMTESRQVPRRTIARGALWAAPTLGLLAASSAPALALSPSCQNCSTPLAGGGASTAVVTGNRGALAIAGAFTAQLTGCTGLVAGGVVTTHQATLTMSDGNVYTTTANLGVGPHVAGVAALGSGISFPNVRFPNGTYASAAGVGSLPVRPRSLCFSLSIPIRIGGTVNDCSQTVCFAPSFLNANLGLIALGSGTVTYGTVWQSA